MHNALQSPDYSYTETTKYPLLVDWRWYKSTAKHKLLWNEKCVKKKGFFDGRFFNEMPTSINATLVVAA